MRAADMQRSLAELRAQIGTWQAEKAQAVPLADAQIASTGDEAQTEVEEAENKTWPPTEIEVAEQVSIEEAPETSSTEGEENMELTQEQKDILAKSAQDKISTAEREAKFEAIYSKPA